MAFCKDFSSIRPNKKLFSLFIPIFIETFLLMLSGIVDTFMLSSVSDEAVGAVGTANTYIGMFFLLFAVISSGLLAVMTQYIGAGKKGVAFQARQLAIVINGVFGIVISLLLGLLSPYIIKGLGVAPSLQEYAITYLRIVGAACLFDALIPVFSCYLRAFDKTKYSLIAAFTGNIVNLGLNALFLFAFNMGVVGVAIGTIIGKLVNLALCLIFGYHLVHGLRFPERESRMTIVKQIVRVGLPAAIETAVYSFAMAAVMTFLNIMDPGGFNAKARSYATQITNFSYCVAFALAQANVIICGWDLGKGNVKDCYKSTRGAALIGIGIAIVVELIFALTSPWILRIFTSDQELIRIIRLALFIDIALEVGRAGNLIYGTTLKSTGDSIFPMVVSSIATALFAIGGGYLFGNVLGWGVLGAYFALTLDECIRAVIMFIRWMSGRWEKLLIFKKENNDNQTV